MTSDEHAPHVRDGESVFVRIESGREPRFERQRYISGTLAYDLSSDYRARWLLLGGGTPTGDMMLVLTETPARFQNAREEIGFGRPRTCGRADASVSFAVRLAQGRFRNLK